jgi:hypothetical protein
MQIKLHEPKDLVNLLIIHARHALA